MFDYVTKFLDLAIQYSALKNGISDYFLSILYGLMGILMFVLCIVINVAILVLIIGWPFIIGHIVTAIYENKLAEHKNIKNFWQNFTQSDIDNILFINDDIDDYVMNKVYEVLNENSSEKYFAGQNELLIITENYLNGKISNEKALGKINECFEQNNIEECIKKVKKEYENIIDKSDTLAIRLIKISYILYFILLIPVILRVLT